VSLTLPYDTDKQTLNDILALAHKQEMVVYHPQAG
jgi:hypothetical protein